MAKKLGVISSKTFEKLVKFDYGDLYSIHKGTNCGYWENDDAVEIITGVNRFDRLYIIASIDYGKHFKTFDFDRLDEAVEWVKRRVDIVDEKSK